MHMLVDASADAVYLSRGAEQKKWQNGKTWVKNICFRILREFCRMFLVWVRASERALRYNGISGQCASTARLLFLSLNFWISWSLLNTWLHSLAISNTPFQLKLQITAQINQRAHRKKLNTSRQRERESRKRRKLSTISFYLSAFLVCF